MGNSGKIHRLWTKTLAIIVPIIAAICVCVCLTTGPADMTSADAATNYNIGISFSSNRKDVTKEANATLSSLTQKELEMYCDTLLDEGTICTGVALSASVVDVASCRNSSYVLYADGSVWSTGRNNEGQLGIGSTSDSKALTKVQFDQNADVKATAISAGDSFAMLIDDQGHVWAAGANSVGQLGINSKGGNSTVFKRTTFSGRAAKIDCGSNHTLMIDDQGHLWGTGQGGVGQFGDGKEADYSSFTQLLSYYEFKDVAAIELFSVVLDVDGAVYTTGDNRRGQLGRGVDIEKTPYWNLAVFKDNENEVMINPVAIDGGDGFAMILDDEGAVYGAGANSSGQLGLNDSTDRNYFTKVSFADGAKIGKISCGSDFTIAVSSSSPNTCYVTGNNSKGQFGNNSNIGGQTFTSFSVGFPVADIAAGNQHAIAFSKAGQIFGTGANTIGQLANNESSNGYNRMTPPAEDEISALNFSQAHVVSKMNSLGTKTSKISIWASVTDDITLTATPNITSCTYSPEGTGLNVNVKLQVNDSEGNAYKGSYLGQVLYLKNFHSTRTAKTDATGTATITYTENRTAGTYEMYVQYPFGNCSSQPYEFTINRAPIEPSVTLDNWTYGSSANEHAVTGNTGGGNVSLLYTGTSAGGISYDASDAPVAAGSYKLTATIEQSTNYLGGTCYVEFLILPKKITVTVDGKTSVYGDALSELTYAADEGALVQGDTTEGLGVSLSKAQGETVGRYLITGSATNPNYYVEFTEAYYEITKATYDMNGAGWNYTEAFTYDGTEKTVAVTGLPEGVTVAEYAGNVATNAGEYSASVTLAYDETNYNAPPAIDGLVWTIKKATYNMSGAGWNYTDAFTYDGTEKTVAVKGLPAGVTVAEYAGNTGTNAGEYTASVRFTYDDEANYNAPTLDALTWTINKATYDMSGAGWNYTDAFMYDGTEKTVEVTGLPEGITVAEYAGNTGTNAGDYSASVTFTYDETNYNAPTLDALTWTITKATYDMSGAAWNYTDAFTYDGTEKAVAITGLPTGVTIAEYAGNTGTNAGEYTANVTFTYDETNYNAPTIDALTWTINKATYDMSGAGWNYTDAFTYDGTEKTVEVTGLPTGVTVAEYAGNTGTNAGDYTASVTFTYDEINYNAPTIDALSWTINKATYDMSGAVWNYTDAFTYDGTEKTIEVTGLPMGVTVAEYSGNAGTNAGEYSASVTFTYDEANYNAPTLDALNWTIKKATYNMTGVKFQNAKVTYDGKSHGLTITGTLPKGVTVKYVGNDKTVVGTYEVTAKFTGDPNYEPIADMKATLTIEKAPDPEPVEPEPEKGGCNGCGGSVTDGIALAGASTVLLFFGIVIAVRKARKKK